MIFGTNTKWPVGSVVETFITNYDGIPTLTRFLIVRESNQEEYAKAAVSDKWPLERLIKTRAFHCEYFYEISTD